MYLSTIKYADRYCQQYNFRVKNNNINFQSTHLKSIPLAITGSGLLISAAFLPKDLMTENGKSSKSIEPKIQPSDSEEQKLLIDNKIKLLGEKLKINFSHEDMSNPILRYNINKFYDAFMNKDLSFCDEFKKRKLTFSPEVFSYIKDVHDCCIFRASGKNYPMEIIEHAINAEKEIAGQPENEPIIKSDSDRRYGAIVMNWYQKTFNNSGEVNNSLRTSTPLSEEAEEVITFFDSHQRPIGKNTVLIRGTDYTKFLKVGDILTDKGYMSCATPKGFIENVDDFSSPFTRFKDFLIIKVTADQKVIVPMDYTGIDSMGERILPRNTSLKVTKIEPLTDYGSLLDSKGISGRRAIICEVV